MNQPTKTQLHCDKCGKAVGQYLYGAKGDPNAVCNNANIYGEAKGFRLPDIICYECSKRRVSWSIDDTKSILGVKKTKHDKRENTTTKG